jgi:hypothetical protein
MGNDMLGNNQTSTPLNEVTALFAASASSFGLSDGATFADLADRLAELGEWHAGTPRAIYLKLACPATFPALPVSNETEGNF